MGEEERAARERERAVIAHRRAAKARRWSLRELRLSAAMRYARQAEALEKETLGRRTSRDEGRDR
jgi:hypothetical protein